MLVSSGAGRGIARRRAEANRGGLCRTEFRCAQTRDPRANTVVSISAQQGLWYQLTMPASPPGFVRVNDVRIAYADVEDGEANVRVLMEGKAGKGRVTETAGVRGIDESDLRSAAFNQAQLDAMIGYRADPTAAAAYAREHGWQATSVAYAGEARPGERRASVGRGAAPSRQRHWRSPSAASSAALGSSAGRNCSKSQSRASWRGNPRRTLPRKSSRSARRSPAASWARDRCGTMRVPSSASTSSDAGSPRRPAVPTCHGPSASSTRPKSTLSRRPAATSC